MTTINAVCDPGLDLDPEKNDFICYKGHYKENWYTMNHF